MRWALRLPSKANSHATWIAKVPNMEIDKSDKDKFFTHWDHKRKIFTMQVREERNAVLVFVCGTKLCEVFYNCLF